MKNDKEKDPGSNFIHQIVEQDLEKGTNGDRVLTRFPPEPNGYLHIGHAQSIGLNFSIASKYGGKTNLRFDDTNPTTEDIEFVESIKRDIKWLGFDWEDRLYFASDYFEKLYDLAIGLVRKGKAYVDSSSLEEIREMRGSVTEPGQNSPFRDRSVEENLELFAGMRAGEFTDGSHVLRAKIDMASPNMLLRDPLLYRIRKAHHYRTGDDWCIYPMYDYAHPLSDAIEGVTHSICTLEFEVHRPLYDWLIKNADVTFVSRQYEFARLNPDFMVTSKRKLKKLVAEGHVSGWDDPRMPTIAGLRRRGVTPTAIRAFCEKAGVSKVDSRTGISLFEYCLRDELNSIAPRRMAVLEPLKITLSNWEDGRVEMMPAPYGPIFDGKNEKGLEGSSSEDKRLMPLTKELFIERSDFSVEAPKGFKRLIPGGDVRLRHGYIITCDEVVRNESGDVEELICSYDPSSKSGSDKSGKKVKGTIHWVSASRSVPVRINLFDRLFAVENPNIVQEGQSFMDHLNPDSLRVIEKARVEPSVLDLSKEERIQFERHGYFFQDEESSEEELVFNMIVGLRDTWAAGEEKTSKNNEEKDAHVQKEQVLSDEQIKARDEILSQYDISDEFAIIISESELLIKVMSETVQTGSSASDAANWVVNDVLRVSKDGDLKFTGAQLAELISMVNADHISASIGRKVFEEMASSGKDPESIVEEESLSQISDSSELQAIVNQVLEEHADKVEIYRSGKTGVAGFLVGQVMQKTGGKANPKMVKDLIVGSI